MLSPCSGRRWRRAFGPRAWRRSHPTTWGWPSSARSGSWTRSPTSGSPPSTAGSRPLRTSKPRSSGCGRSGHGRRNDSRPGLTMWPGKHMVRDDEGLHRALEGGKSMTEIADGTTGGAGGQGGRRSRKGLKIKRIFTTPGVHPYDEVEWERRDVVMTNWRDGSVNFEQRGVEFPSFWSMNATNIVTTKYFRGALGTPQREWSLKQVVDRVVGVYTKTGLEHGYFATEEDAEIFDHELKYALIHQIFSFNSPVWFNVGTASPQQVSACFILSVDDTMGSILEWYKEEGLIFKGGSGAGVNLSRIR